MQHNAKIAATQLTGEGILITIAFIHEGKEASAALPLETSKENISMILRLTDTKTWEQVINSYLRVNVETINDKLQLTQIGHILVDEWVDLNTADKLAAAEDTAPAVEDVSETETNE